MLTVRFSLQGGGWADLEIVVDDQRLSILALDFTDVLGDLSAAVVRLAEGDDRSEAIVLDEGHEYLLRFERRGRDGVVVEVLRAGAPRDLDPGAPERVVLSATCGVRELVKTTSQCLDGIVRSLGISGYETMSSAHPFPRELRRRLAAWEGARKRL